MPNSKMPDSEMPNTEMPNSQIQDQSIGSRFTASSSTYDRHANIQDQVAVRLMELIDSGPDVDRILELGCGTGRLTQKICERFSAADITAVDLSEAMIGQAKIRFDAGINVDWVASDICDYVTDQMFPLIVSSSSLHWVTPIDRAFEVIDQSIEPGGQIVLAIMLRDTLGELHDARLRVAPHKPPQSRLPMMDDVLNAGHRLGWETLHQSQSVFTVQYASARDLLVAIHQQGLTGGSVSRSHLPLTRGEIASLIKDYDSRYQNDSGKVIASYQVGFLRCRKVE
ncbi:methyltransferase domain-containing protein [Rubripirellula obstinata]|nr:methyltransferase domain-containing protein [Rubripirellula obstinata]